VADEFDDPNLPHMTVPCAQPNCGWSFFVAKDDPRLPNGPFFCHEHGGFAPTGKPENLDQHTSPRIRIEVVCDGCSARLAAEGPTAIAAQAELDRLRKMHGWNIRTSPRQLLRALGALATRSRDTVSLYGDEPDLCSDCQGPKAA
jgi:hypothetical protein